MTDLMSKEEIGRRKKMLAKLHVAAKNFLVESYPGATDVLTDCQNGTWLLDAKVHSLDPISRFCASWIDKVQIYSEELRKAISNYINTKLIPYCLG